MELRLEDLTKGTKVKEFKFLSSLESVIKKEFGKNILTDKNFTDRHFNEIMANKKITDLTLVAYKRPEELIVLKGSQNIRTKENKKVESSVIERTVISFSRNQTVIKSFERDYVGWFNSVSLKLNEIFVVTDVEAFETYALELMVAQEEEGKKLIEVSETRKREEAIKLNNLCKKYDVTNRPRQEDKTAFKVLESLESGTPKEKFKAIKEMISGNECCCCCDDDY